MTFLVNREFRPLWNSTLRNSPHISNVSLCHISSVLVSHILATHAESCLSRPTERGQGFLLLFSCESSRHDPRLVLGTGYTCYWCNRQRTQLSAVSTNIKQLYNNDRNKVRNQRLCDFLNEAAHALHQGLLIFVIWCPHRHWSHREQHIFHRWPPRKRKPHKVLPVHGIPDYPRLQRSSGVDGLPGADQRAQNSGKLCCHVLLMQALGKDWEIKIKLNKGVWWHYYELVYEFNNKIRWWNKERSRSDYTKKTNQNYSFKRWGNDIPASMHTCFSLYLKVIITAQYGAHLSATVCQGHEQVEQDV